MRHRDKAVIVRTVLCILSVSQAFCMPKTEKIINGVNKCRNAQNQITQGKRNVENNAEALYQKYNYPQITFSTGFKTNPNFEDFSQNNCNEYESKRTQYNNAFQKFKSKNARVISNKARKAHRNFHRKLENTLEVSPKYSVCSNFGTFPYFPEVEYPMTATDIWKPSYWGNYFQTADNKQTDIEIKPCKLLKSKGKNGIKSFKMPAKTKTVRPAQNYTKEEICPLRYTGTTKTPYSNNFIIKDGSIKSVNDNVTSEATPAPNSSEVIKELGRQNCNNLCKITNTESSRNDTCGLGREEPENSCETKNASSFEAKTVLDTSQSKESGTDGEFTTDDPEYAYASTPLPYSTVNTWKETQIIEPSNSLPDPDELDDYFIAVEG